MAYYSQNGKIAFSSKNSRYKSAIPKLSTPTLRAGASYNQIKIVLNWNSISGSHGYEIYRSTSAYGTYSRLGSYNRYRTSTTNIGIRANRTYYYKIRAFRQISDIKVVYSDFSKYASAKVRR